MGSCQSIHNGSVAEPKIRGKPQLIIKSFTWSRDSHGLFDYESKTLTKNNLKSSNTGKIVRKGNEIALSKETDQTNSNLKELLRLNIKDGNFWVGSCIDSALKGPKGNDLEDWEDNERSVWLVVKSFKPYGSSKCGYKLNEGDLLKLGRIKFRIKELRGSPSFGSNNNSNAKKQNAEKVDKRAKTHKEEDNDLLNDSERRGSKCSNAGSRSNATQTCRICLGEQAEVDDPFFSPCHCSGTMKYIHVKCLQQWLKSKLHVKQTGFSTSIYWKTLECELCKTTYPSSCDVAGKKYDMIEIERPECGYLMLEILSKEKNVLRGIHIIKMEGKSNIRLGRGHDSDIRITDISVSRCHALIRLEKGSFYIEDNNSKFGTLVHLKKPFALYGDYSNISLQVGRSVLSITAKKSWKPVSGCFGGSPVRDPTEIDEEDLFGKPIEHQSPSHENDHVRPGTNLILHENVGPFDDGHAHEEVVPQNQHEGHEGDELEEDRLSNMSAEEGLNGEPVVENQDHQAGPNQRPEEQAQAQAIQASAEQQSGQELQVVHLDQAENRIEGFRNSVERRD